MIEMRKWSASSDGRDNSVKALEQPTCCLVKSALTRIKWAEVLRSDVNSCALAEDEGLLVGFFSLAETGFEAEVPQIAVLLIRGRKQDSLV